MIPFTRLHLAPGPGGLRSAAVRSAAVRPPPASACPIRPPAAGLSAPGPPAAGLLAPALLTGFALSFAALLLACPRSSATQIHIIRHRAALSGGRAAQGAGAPIPAAISGSVGDPSGANIAGASVQVQLEASAQAPAPGSSPLQAESLTDSRGRFSFALPPGTYRVEVVSPGFEPLVLDHLRVGGQPLPPLHVKLRIATEKIIVTVEGVATGVDSNDGALILRQDKLDTLSNDDQTLQRQLLALAGGDPAQPPQIFVDGFSGARFPPKTSIREVRINQDPYSAAYDGYGVGRVEVFTRPGTGKLHAFLQAQGNDIAFNARNPFTGAQPPYHLFNLDGNAGGPLGRAASFFLSATYLDQQNNSVVNAVTLDSALQPYSLSQAVPDPQTTQTYSARLDRQFGSSHSVTSRFEYNRDVLHNAGVGLLVLPSQGFSSAATTQTLQLGDTDVMGSHLVNETRFQYIRTRLFQTPVSGAPAVLVEGSFSGGGSPLQLQRDNQDRFEFQDYLSFARGHHFLRSGIRYRLLRDSNQSTADYNGQFTFPDLTAYRITLQGLAAGLSGAQIRALGGGPTQFNLTAGRAGASIVTGDLGLYLDDEWRPAENLTLDLGLRFESQSDIPDHVDPAPRLGFSWAVHQAGKRAPWFTLHGGTGLFYQRFPASAILQAARQDGVTQQSYFVQDPDFYPSVPTPSTLSGSLPAPYRVAPRLSSAYDIVSGLSVDRRMGRFGIVSASYLNYRGVHQFLSLNVNAPLPGTYNPAVPLSGERPNPAAQDIFQYSSTGLSRGSVVYLNTTFNPAPWLSLWQSYIFEHLRTDANGVSSFASNSYDIGADYGRAANQAAHRLFLGATLSLPRGLSLESFLIVRSGEPFDITTGADNNGDTVYNDRPAFATDLTRASVVRTSFGNFDASPLPSQTIIPVNYGTGPAFVSLDLTLNKSFKFGPRPRPSAPASQSSFTGAPASSPDSPAARPDPAFEMGFSAEADNLLNHVNGALPIGVLTSPFFGKSITLDNSFVQNPAANRTVTLRAFFRF